MTNVYAPNNDFDDPVNELHFDCYEAKFYIVKKSYFNLESHPESLNTKDEIFNTKKIYLAWIRLRMKLK